MININDKISCCGCYACFNSCPQKCISMQSDDEGFWYPKVKIEECTDCGLCEKVCPILFKNTVHSLPLAYACINKDVRIRRHSSSGGMFTLLAENVINNSGVVFGAGFDGAFNVIHSWTDNADDLIKFRGSKYVQSCIGNTYKQAEDLLKQGRQVLFSGTPCQIAGLKSYLGKDYENLICLDIICHGVPSPSVWEKYRSKIANNRGLKAISFRDKTYGWKNFSLRFTFNNDDGHIKDLSNDEFIQGFLQVLYLRPSCYKCNFKTIKRQSDVTLADFWGIENVIPSFDDDRGTSLILVNSQKGKIIFSSVVDKMDYEKVDIGQTLLYNSSAVKSVDYNPKRDKFFQELSGTADINQLIAKYTKANLLRKMYVKLRALLSRIKVRILRETNDLTTNFFNFKSKPSTPLKIETYDGGNEAMHPKVLHFVNAFSGYKFWMCYTPFCNSNEAIENPCIAVSNDGYNWMVPDGLNNPIDNITDVSIEYNSDPHLVFNIDTNKLECWFRYFIRATETEVIYRKTSTDGVNWGNKEELYRASSFGRGIISPAIMYDSDKKQYRIWASHQETYDKTNRSIAYYESDSNGSNWNLIRKIKLNSATHYPSHLDVILTRHGYDIVVQMINKSNGILEYIMYSNSKDNIRYTTPTILLGLGRFGSWDNGRLYRPSLNYINGSYWLYYCATSKSGKWATGLIKSVANLAI